MKTITAAAIFLIVLSSGCKENPVVSSEPVVEILSPTGNISSYDSVQVTIKASDDKNVVRVELFIDHSLAQVFTNEPYEYTWYIQYLPDGSQHVLEAQAYDEEGNVAGSKPVIIYTYRFRPSDLMATFVSDTTVNLSWSDNSTVETGFEIEKRINNSEFALERSVGANVTNAIVQCTNAFTDTIYFRVRAIKENEKSEYSNTAEAHRTLSSPTNIGISFDNDTTIHVTWKDNTTFESGYRIQIGMQVFDQIPANTTEYSVPFHMYSGEYYNAAVTAVRGKISSASVYSPGKQFVVPAPYELSLVPQVTGGVTISWKDSCSYETGFIIERAEPTGTFSVIGRTGANELHYTDSNIDTLKRYLYRVETAAKYTSSSPSKNLTIGCEPALSLITSCVLPNGTSSFSLSKDQRKAVTTDFNSRSISIWNVESMTLERTIVHIDSTLQGPECAELQPDGTKVAVGFYYHSAILFDAASGSMIASIEPAPSNRAGVKSLAYSPDGSKLVTSGWGLNIWQDKTNANLGAAISKGYTSLVKYSPTEDVFISNPNDGGGVSLYDGNSFASIRRLSNSADASLYAFNPDGSLIAGVASSRLVVWDSKTGAIVNQLNNYYSRNCIGMNSDRDFLYTSQSEGGISIWSTRTGGVIFNVTANLAQNELIQLSRDGKYLYSAGGSTMRKWEIKKEWRPVLPQ